MFARANRFKPGQLLATLDPTFAAANVKQLRQQIASLRRRSRASRRSWRTGHWCFRNSSDPDFANYAAACKKRSMINAVVNTRRRSTATTRRFNRLNATIQKLQGDEGRYQQREGIAKRHRDDADDARESGSGSRLNMLISQDARLEMLRSLESTHNSLDRSRGTRWRR